MANEIEELALKLAVVVDHLERRAEQANLMNAESSQLLAAAAQDWARQGEQTSRQAVAAICSQSRQAIDQGVDEVLGKLRTELSLASESARNSARLLADQTRSLKQAQQGLLWKGGLALLVGTVLAVAASGYWSWKSMKDLERAAFASDILAATEAGQITRCGKALCVRVGQEAKRYGNNGEYLLVQE